MHLKQAASADQPWWGVISVSVILDAISGKERRLMPFRRFQLLMLYSFQNIFLGPSILCPLSAFN